MIRWGGGFYRVYGEENVPPRDSNRRIPLRCPICGTHTDAPIVCMHVTQQNDFVRLPSSFMALYNYLVRCTRCNSGLFVAWSYGDEPGPGAGGHTAGVLVLPLRASAFETEMMAVDAVPAAILEDLRQAELAFYAGAHYGAGLLLRRACQNITRHQGIPQNGLKEQTEEMARRGIITTSLAEMADGIRIIGNELAHPDPNTPSVITPDDVRLAREFLVQMVRAIYVEPARVKKLRDDLKKKGVE